uniref:Uncharacterized protein n=1 Tax=Peronospora matthiolae TaxID=2874970 RepID=A0AAV1T7V2_9STRA
MTPEVTGADSTGSEVDHMVLPAHQRSTEMTNLEDRGRQAMRQLGPQMQRPLPRVEVLAKQVLGPDSRALSRI